MKALKIHWDKSPSWKIRLGRDYKFKFLPLGFFARVIVRLFHLGGVKLLTFWYVLACPVVSEIYVP